MSRMRDKNHGSWELVKSALQILAENQRFRKIQENYSNQTN